MLDLDKLDQDAGAVPVGEKMMIDPEVLLALTVRLRTAEACVRIVARSAVMAAEQSGQQMTVTRVSLQPPAMGNHVPHISFHSARERAK